MKKIQIIRDYSDIKIFQFFDVYEGDSKIAGIYEFSKAYSTPVGTSYCIDISEDKRDKKIFSILKIMWKNNCKKIINKKKDKKTI